MLKIPDEIIGCKIQNIKMDFEDASNCFIFKTFLTG